MTTTKEQFIKDLKQFLKERGVHLDIGGTWDDGDGYVDVTPPCFKGKEWYIDIDELDRRLNR